MLGIQYEIQNINGTYEAHKHTRINKQIKSSSVHKKHEEVLGLFTQRNSSQHRPTADLINAKFTSVPAKTSTTRETEKTLNGNGLAAQEVLNAAPTEGTILFLCKPTQETIRKSGTK